MKKIYFLCLVLLLNSNSYSQWKPTNGPFSPNFSTLGKPAFIINGDKIGLASFDDILISGDNGNSWIMADNGLTNRSHNIIRSMAYFGDTIIVGTQGTGIYISTNNGSTYKQLECNIQKTADINAIIKCGKTLVIGITGQDTPYINGIFFSNDYGNNWLKASGIENEIRINSFKTDGTTIYCGTNFGIYKSTDKGQTWKNIGLIQTDIAAINVNGNKIYAGSNYSVGAVYYSSDDGAHWTSITDNLPGSFFKTIEIDNKSSIYIQTTYNGIYKSTNNGDSWINITNNLDKFGIHAFAIKGNLLFAVNSFNKICVSTNDGAIWRPVENTVYKEINSMINYNSRLLVSTNYGAYSSKNNGLLWTNSFQSFQTFAANDSLLFIGSLNELEVFNRDSSKVNSFTYDLPNDPNITTIAVNDSLAFAGINNNGIYFSRNNGKNWIKANNGLTDSVINSISISDTTIFAGTNSKGIFISKNNGNTWHSSNIGLIDTCIQTIATYKNNIYIGTKNHGIFKSTNNGNSWSQINSGLLDSTILCLYIYGENIFAGVYGKGLFLSTNNGNSWTQYNTGLLNVNINSIIGNDTSLFVGIKGAGVWKRNLTDFPLKFSIKKLNAKSVNICEGTSTSIEVSSVGGTSPNSYLWSTGETSETIIVSPTKPTIYHVTITDSNSKKITDEILIRLKPNPSSPIITYSGDTLISNYIVGNQWYLNNQAIYYGIDQKFLAYQKGDYYDIVTINGCSSNNQKSVKTPIISSYNNIYPNPVKNTIIIETNLPTIETNLSVYNIFGQELLKQLIKENQTQIDLSNFPSGIYYINLKTDKSIYTKTFIKE